MKRLKVRIALAVLEWISQELWTNRDGCRDLLCKGIGLDSCPREAHEAIVAGLQRLEAQAAPRTESHVLMFAR